MTTTKAGDFCWLDLATDDVEGAKAFYTQLLNWSTTEMPLPEGGSYTLAGNDQGNVGGIYQMPPEMQQQGVPPHWLSYIQVDNADETARLAQARGAGVRTEPLDVMDIGRMAVIADPAGAAFAIWQSLGDENGNAPRDNSPGTVTWTELTTTDIEGARNFYTDVFGWRIEDAQMPDRQYLLVNNGEVQNAGMMAITPEMGSVPPAWTSYFMVEDCDSSTQAATGLGGKTLRLPADIPGVGRFSVVQDPQGAVFCLFHHS